jgi:predicted O-methyltransferase YrrM
MLDVISSYGVSKPEKLKLVKGALDVIALPDFLSRLQGYALAAVADHLNADVILDLGSGPGNSAAVFSAARPNASIHSFDLEDLWPKTRESLEPLGIGANVLFHLGDMTQVDFAPLVRDATSVLVFWDAHGYSVADHVLGHIMPLVADKRHLVVCHDMSHKKFASRGYEGKPLWRGMNSFGHWPGETAFVTIGWTVSAVDQVVPIIDFCNRNDIEFRSFDGDIHVSATQEQRSRLAEQLDMQPLPAVHMGYFTMGETSVRYFPVAKQ